MIRMGVIGVICVASSTVGSAQIAVPVTSAGPPVEHRLTPDEIAAAQADGAERNHAAELLAMTRGDPSLALPVERPKKVHGEAGFGIGTGGAREVFGAVTTDLGNGGSATVAGEYQQFGRTRYRAR